MELIFDLSFRVGTIRRMSAAGVGRQMGDISFSRRRGMSTTSIWALQERNEACCGEPPNSVQLTTGPMSTYVPLPSPDGKRIYLVGVKNRGK